MGPDTPVGWRREPLRNLGYFLKGRGGSRADDEPSGVPVVRYGELYTRHHEVIRDFYSFISPERARDYTPLRRGDLLLAGSGEKADEIGKAAVFLGPEPAYAGGDTIIFRPSGRIDPVFLGYASNGPEATAYKMTVAQGSSVVHIYVRDLEDLQISLPPLPEQRKIAAILSSIDDAIAATRKVIEQTKRVKQGLLQALMTRGIGHTRFKAVPQDWVIGRLPGLEEIPHEWEVTRLTDVARLESGHTPARGRDDYWGGDVPWVSLHDTDRLAQRVIRDTAMTVTEAGLANSSARLLPEGTVVFSRTATVGRCSILGRPMATSQDFANYICGPRVHNRFLCHLFRSMGAVWKSLCAGSTHQTVYMPDFKKLRIALPPVAEQMEIASRIDAVDDVLEMWPRYLQSMNQLKRGLMQDLLTGRVRVQPD